MLARGKAPAHIARGAAVRLLEAQTAGCEHEGALYFTELSPGHSGAVRGGILGGYIACFPPIKDDVWVPADHLENGR